MARRFLVTGASGFLGRAVTHRLADQPATELVVALDQSPDLPAGARIRAVRRDIREPVDDVLVEHAIEAVVHHAFVVHTPRDEATARTVNVGAAESLVDACKRAGVARIVYPSSTTVYGAWPDSAPHFEDEEPRPVPGFSYSEHKVAAERALLSAAASGGPLVVVLRACVVLAPGADNFIASSLGLPVFPLPAGADPPMQFLTLADYLSAVESALSASQTRVYNVAGRDTIRVRDMVRLAGGRPLPMPDRLLRTVVDGTWRLRLQHRAPAAGVAFIRHPWLASTERIESELGWTARSTSREAVESWARNRRGGRHRG